MNEKKNQTAVLVISAISDMKETNGSTVKQIAKFIEHEYEIPGREYKRNLQKTLQKGVAFGALKKSGGRYQIGEVLKKLSTAKSSRGARRAGAKRSRSRTRARRRAKSRSRKRCAAKRRRRTARSRSRARSRAARRRRARRAVV